MLSYGDQNLTCHNLRRNAVTLLAENLGCIKYIPQFCMASKDDFYYTSRRSSQTHPLVLHFVQTMIIRFLTVELLQNTVCLTNRAETHCAYDLHALTFPKDFLQTPRLGHVVPWFRISSFTKLTGERDDRPKVHEHESERDYIHRFNWKFDNHKVGEWTTR